MPLGTKQGGVLSPGFFSLYIDEMVNVLRASGLGCHIAGYFLGSIFFADDLAIMAPTKAALQEMISLCSNYYDKYCLQFNSSKSKVMIFGKNHYDSGPPLIINGALIDFVTEWKYLGTTLVSGKHFSFSARNDLTSFFRAANSIINVLTGAHEHVLLTLLYTNCIPILSYACSVKEYSASEMSSCNVAVNNVFRKIFGFTRWESIRVLRQQFGLKSIYEIFKKAKDTFAASCLAHHNPIVSFLARIEC